MFITTPPISPAFIPTWFTRLINIAITKVAKIGPLNCDEIILINSITVPSELPNK